MKLLAMLALPLFGFMAAAPNLGLTGPNACRAAVKLTTNGIEMYCPTTACPDVNECNQNGGDTSGLWWCACGVGGKVSADCNAVWKERDDGSLKDYDCINIACDASCRKATFPQEIGQAVHACNCQ